MIIKLTSVNYHWVNFACDLSALKAKKPLVDLQATWSTTDT